MGASFEERKPAAPGTSWQWLVFLKGGDGTSMSNPRSLGIPKRRLPPASPSYANYGVLDLRYSDGSPAVLRHVDGTGFAYYQSGRKAICLSAQGIDANAKARRFGAVLHDDAPRSPVIGVFDEWGRGYADGMLNPGDQQQPKVMVAERIMTKIDGNGKATEFPTRPKGSSSSPTHSGSDLAMRLNTNVTLNHKGGRTSLDFSSEGISYNFILGELFGDEVPGMPKAQSATLRDHAARKLEEANSRLNPVCDLYSNLKVDPSQRDTKPSMRIDASTATLKDLTASLNTLRTSLTHPNLAKIEHSKPEWKWNNDPDHAEWSTELGLKRELAKQHPQCVGQTKKNWSIARMGGKCTEERLANAKPTVTSPKTVQMISQLRLTELAERCAGKGTLLVVICLATYSKEQSAYAMLTAEKAQVELAQRMGGDIMDSVRFVAIELSEAAGFAEQYSIRETPPYYMMFRGGAPVQQHSEDGQPTVAKRLPGVRIRLSHEGLSRPQVLLVEPNPGHQCKLERALRRSGYQSDLGLDGSHGLRLASRQQVYGVLIISAQPAQSLRADAARSIITAVRRNEPNALIVAYNAASPSEEVVRMRREGRNEDAAALEGEENEARKRLLEECTHAFPSVPSYTGLQTVLARCEIGHPTFGKGCIHKKDFCDEIQGVLEHGRGQSTIWGTTTLLPSDLAAT